MSVVKNIVCIDDEKNILELNKLLIEGLGDYKVHCFTSGPEALGTIKTLKPDLILLDMIMPVMDGIAVLKMLRNDADLRTIPVIFMTAKKNASDIKQYMDMGALSVITKPIDVEDFPHQIALLSKYIAANP